MKQTQKDLGVSRSTVYGLLANGDLQAVKIGGRTLITDASLSAFVARLPAARFASPGATPPSTTR